MGAPVRFVFVLLVLAVPAGCGFETAGSTVASTGTRAPAGTNPLIPAPSVTVGSGGGPSPDGTASVPGSAPGSSSTPSSETPAPLPTIPIPDGWISAEAPPIPTAPATALLDRLVVTAPDPRRPDYRRDEFGDGWSYDRSSGCNVREYVLVTESRRSPQMGEKCRPLSGEWISLYDGVATTDPAALEIDHVVALSDAWRSGAWRWSPARREAFANDLIDPGSLVAVTTRSNRSKGDSPPDQWLPEAFEARCDFVEAWVRIKARWDLSVTPAEKSTLVQVLSGC